MLYSDNYFILQISGLVKSIRMLADMGEPIGQILKKTEVETSYIIMFITNW